MSLVGNLFSSSIGRKFLMAVTGLVLVGFVIGHLVGNLQIFGQPEAINGYAHFLQALGPTLWVARLFLLACVAIHIWAAVVLTMENTRARGSQRYATKRFIKASLASRTMRWSGVVVLAFIVYHLAHFTLGLAGAETFKSGLALYTMREPFHLFGLSVVEQGAQVHDVYSMVYLGFTSWIVSLFYIIAIGLLTVHLWHGTDSMFQTIGWRSTTWAPQLRGVVAIFCVLYFLGNLAIPGAIVTGLLKPHENTYAAQALAARAAAAETVASQR